MQTSKFFFIYFNTNRIVCQSFLLFFDKDYATGTKSTITDEKNRKLLCQRNLLLLHQLTLEELYKAWGAKDKEESRRNTVVLQGFQTQNFASQAKQKIQESVGGEILTFPVKRCIII